MNAAGKWILSLLLGIHLLAATFASVSPELHHACHQEAAEPQHLCLAVLLTSDLLEESSPQIFVFRSSLSHQQLTGESFSVPHSSFDLLPPGRAPPFLS